MRFLLSLALVLNTACTTIPKAQAALTGLDTFGSKRISAEQVTAQYGPRINDWVTSVQKDPERAEPLKQAIVSELRKQYGFAFVELSLITYFEPRAGQHFVTVDVVEPEDVATRMAFLPEPSGHFEDPDGLIALWDQYLNLGFDLQRAGKFEYPKSCPAWHCTHGFEHPALVPFLEKFNRLVPPNEKRLAAILKEDARANFRANAAFLLAHIKSGKAVAAYVLGALYDSSFLVRNNTTRVLSEIVRLHPEIEVPVEPVLKVLNFPATTDRNKAGHTLAFLAKKEPNKPLIIKSGGRILLEMLKLQQPNNHDPAYEILKILSGKNFGERDYQAWESWLSKQAI